MNYSLCIIKPIQCSRVFRQFFGLIIIGLIFSNISMAQTPEYENNTKFWVDIGLGFSAAGSGSETDFGGGLAGRVAAHIQIRQIILSAPLTVNRGGNSKYDSFFGKLSDEYYDTALLVGYPIAQDKKIQLIASAGVSWVRGRRVVLDIDEDCWLFCSDGTLEAIDPVVGIPVEFGFYSRGKSDFGMGLTTYINFNPEEIFAGFTLNLMIGKRD